MLGHWVSGLSLSFARGGVDIRPTRSSQSVAMIQLNAEEMERYKNGYVFLDFDSGLYTFPVRSISLRVSLIFPRHCVVGPCPFSPLLPRSPVDVI